MNANATPDSTGFWLVVPAAGSGRRMGEGLPKQYQPLRGVPMLQRTLEVFLSLPSLRGAIVALHPDDTRFAALPAARDARIATVEGGAERMDSVRLALETLAARAAPDDWVLVHDAARPLVTAASVQAMVDALAHSPHGGIMAIPVSDTVKQVDAQTIIATRDRMTLWQAQTPQMFRVAALLSALRAASAQGLAVTDEAQAMERTGVQPQVIPGSRTNLKVTVPEDWQLADALLASREAAMTQRPMPRIGQGYDVHRFDAPAPGAFITLGGVRIPHRCGLVAHSDGDVLIHALCDALLGAAALGDIGKHFPDTDARYRNIDSRLLLRDVVALLRQRGFAIVNVDATIVAQAPRVLPHVPDMCANLSADLGLALDSINVKATTTEKLGFEGREEGIGVHAVALLAPA